MLTREVEVLKRLDHPHIIHLVEVLETSQVQHEENMCIAISAKDW